MNLDIKLVFSDTETIFKALASSLAGFFGFYFLGGLPILLQQKYEIQWYISSQIQATNMIIAASVSFFVWLFTDCMQRKLVIFISLLCMTVPILMVGHAEFFAQQGEERASEAEILVLKIGSGMIAGFFPLLMIPLVPELVSNIKTFRQTQFDTKVNDFAGAVHFAFYAGGSALAGIFLNFQVFYLGLPYDIMLAITVVFWICYACYVDVRSTCRKDKEEEEAQLVRLSQK